MKKEVRDSMDYKMDSNTNTLCVQWQDNTTVTMVSTVDGIEPVTNAKQWDASVKKKIMVPQSSLIKKYNENMVGVDRLDQNVSYYRVGIRSKKWYFQLIAFGIDAAMQNAWQLYRKEKGNNEDALGFRRKIVQTYLIAAKSRFQFKQRKNPKIDSRVPETRTSV